jgi:hypothetical protein
MEIAKLVCMNGEIIIHNNFIEFSEENPLTPLKKTIVSIDNIDSASYDSFSISFFYFCKNCGAKIEKTFCYVDVDPAREFIEILFEYKENRDQNSLKIKSWNKNMIQDYNKEKKEYKSIFISIFIFILLIIFGVLIFLLK